MHTSHTGMLLGCWYAMLQTWARTDGYTSEVCEAWPVQCQIYGYIPSRRTSLPCDWYQLIRCTVWQRYTCVNNLSKIVTCHSFVESLLKVRELHSWYVLSTSNSEVKISKSFVYFSSYICLCSIVSCYHKRWNKVVCERLGVKSHQIVPSPYRSPAVSTFKVWTKITQQYAQVQRSINALPRA